MGENFQAHLYSINKSTTMILIIEPIHSKAHPLKNTNQKKYLKHDDQKISFTRPAITMTKPLSSPKSNLKTVKFAINTTLKKKISTEIFQHPKSVDLYKINLVRE